jgi:hypothetical protein
MSGLIIGKGYVNGIGECYIEQADRPDYLKITNVKTGYVYHRQRASISWRKAKKHHEIPD